MKLEESFDYYNYLKDEKVRRQFNFKFNSKEETNQRLLEIIKGYDSNNKPKIWTIALKESNKMIGILVFVIFL